MKKDKEIILNEQFNVMKKDYNNKPFPTYEERKEILLSLKKSILDNEQKIYQSLNKDYWYRSEFDTLISDIVPIVWMINYSLKNLKKWMRKSRRHSGLFLFPSKVEVHYQPLWVVWVITPWNFPIYLSLWPAIQAIAAWNRVLIKMSETTPETTKIMKKVLSTISKHIDVIDWWPGSWSVFSRLPFNHLIFTGSSYTGKSVAKAAADNLTPITLELGWKSPTIIADDICIESVVNSIMIWKITNGWQICVAPDYIFVPENKKDKFIKTFIKSYWEYYDTNLFNNNRLM